jgi:SAM-dependent methyltransferase
MDRRLILDLIDLGRPGLEIGALDKPTVTRAHGPVAYVDRADRAALAAWYADPGHGIDPADLVDVDHVWGEETLLQAVGGQRAFAYVIASHVIEHVPDLVGFLNACEAILAPGGVLSLAVPDKRYCFDCERENSSLGRIIDVAQAQSTNHSPGTAAEYFLKVRRKGGLIAWNERHQGTLEPVHGLEDAVQAMAKVREGHYFDLHSWVFTPDSFRQIIRDLHDLQFTGLREQHFHPTRGCEFFVTLAKPTTGSQAAA